MAENHLSGPGTALPSHHHISHHHHHIRRHRVPSGGDEHEDEELDPRIQIELEKLNRASEEINRLELELDDARAAFRQVLSDSTQCLNGLAKKLGACVDKARPYYDARMRLKEAHLESQKAALRFERACSMHEAAKEMVQLAEEGYKRREQDLDPTWQEMLNHATMKVNDAERERIESEEFHQRTTLNFKRKEEEVQKLQKDLKRSITKSKPYFEMKAKFNQVMEDHKRTVSRLEEDVGSSKALYSQALRSLEAISDDIHRQRLERRQKLQLGVRGAGVGAEAPSPPPSWEKGINIEGSASSHVFDGDVDEDPLNVSCGSYSSETVLDVTQIKVGRSKGIVRHEPAYRKKTSLTESFIKDGHYKTDPLDVVVFKTSLSDLQVASSTPKYSQEFPPPSVIHCKPDRARSASYCAAIEASSTEAHNNEEGLSGRIKEGMEAELGDVVITPTPDGTTELLGSLKSSPSVALTLRGPELNISGSPERDTAYSPLSESPRKRDIELSQSSISRAQEWVNKSPIPQQRRFVKSKSLVDASSSSLSVSSPSDSELSSSLNTEAIKGIIQKCGHEKYSMPSQILPTAPVQSRSLPIDVKQSPHRKSGDSSQLALSVSPHNANTIRSLGSTPEQASPTLPRRSPKLQGLILRVDAMGINPSTQAVTQSNKGQFYPTAGTNSGTPPKVVISTQHPKLGVFTEKPSQSESSTSSASAFFTSPPVSSLALTLSPSAKPPSSLITQHLNKMMSATKVSPYNSKTAPSTLSTSYRLPSQPMQKSPNTQASPTRNPLSPIPPSATASLRHQLTSPTPSSSSADRFSLSGRSDSVASGSHKGAFLKPPSDSSDTESIASTGPMLDDDQVELINMDFTEQSIAVENPDDNDYGEVPVDLTSIPRGHWSRMSLPPRLSYLEGFLERTRLYSEERRFPNREDSDENLYSKNEEDEDGRSSVAASGDDLDDKCNDFQDDVCDNEVEDLNNANDINNTVDECKAEPMCVSLENDPSCDVVLQVEIVVQDNEIENKANNNVSKLTGGNSHEDVLEHDSSIGINSPVNKIKTSACNGTELEQSTESPVVISPDKNVEVIESCTGQEAEENLAEEDEESELFV